MCNADGTLSAHFGQAPHVVIVTIEDGHEVSRETRPKPHNPPHEHHEHDHAQGHGRGHGHDHDHPGKFSPLADCQMMIVRGIGQPAAAHAERLGVALYAVAEKTVDEALGAYLEGKLSHDPRRIHS